MFILFFFFSCFVFITVYYKDNTHNIKINFVGLVGSSMKQMSSSSHWKLTCSRHDMAEKLLSWSKQQSHTHSKLIYFKSFQKLSLSLCYVQSISLSKLKEDNNKELPTLVNTTLWVSQTIVSPLWKDKTSDG